MACGQPKCKQCLTTGQSDFLGRDWLMMLMMSSTDGGFERRKFRLVLVDEFPGFYSRINFTNHDFINRIVNCVQNCQCEIDQFQNQEVNKLNSSCAFSISLQYHHHLTRSFTTSGHPQRAGTPPRLKTATREEDHSHMMSAVGGSPKSRQSKQGCMNFKV